MNVSGLAVSQETPSIQRQLEPSQVKSISIIVKCFVDQVGNDILDGI